MTSIFISLKATNKTHFFLNAQVHKHPNLEEAVVVLVGFPVVAVHGTDDRHGVVAGAVVADGVLGDLAS